jgi:hypothetical protein
VARIVIALILAKIVAHVGRLFVPLDRESALSAKRMFVDESCSACGNLATTDFLVESPLVSNRTRSGSHLALVNHGKIFDNG